MNENTILNPELLDDLDSRYLLFYIDEILYGVSLTLVLEILQIQNITHLPNVANYVKGIVNLRGKVVPVVDVRLKFNLPERPHSDKTCIIVLDINGTQVGLVVDSVSEVATFKNAKLSSPPAVSSVANQYLSSVTEIGGRVILNIDFERFFQDDMSILRI